MPDLLTNQGSGTVTTGGLTAPTSGTSESWTITGVNAFPAVAAARGTTFKFMDPAQSGEILMATATPGGVGAGQAWTVTRGAEGTAPVIHAAGFTIQELITAGTIAAALGTTQAVQPGSSPAAAEGWHLITMDAGWTQQATYPAPQYRLLPDGNLQLSGVAFASFATSAGKNLNSSNPLPAAYRPANAHDFRTGDLIGGRCHATITNAGVIAGYPPTGATFTANYYCDIDAVVALT